jgi:hypothetical protein
MNTFQENSQVTSEAVVIRFVGVYPPGSAGNDLAGRMKLFVMRSIYGVAQKKVIIDLTELDYVWGDAICQVFYVAIEADCELTVVAQGRTLESLKPLFTNQWLPGAFGAKLIAQVK